MLYFMGYVESGGFTANFNKAIFSELDARNISYVKLPIYDWEHPNVCFDFCRNIDSSEDDAWFMGWAQTPVIEAIKDKKGKKYGFVVGTTANPFEPANILKVDIKEHYRLGLYDKVFTISEWCRNTMINAYPEMKDKLVAVGFPMDFKELDKYKNSPKQPNLVVFNQRFAVEKLPMIEIEVSRRLIAKGYKVRHLAEQPRQTLSSQCKTTAELLDLMMNIGIEFTYNPTKEAYYEQLSQASIAITTSISDTLSIATVEAIYLGVIPVAPRAFGFPEYVNPKNLYSQYDLEEIINIALAKPNSEHDILKYSKNLIIEKFLKEMNIL